MLEVALIVLVCCNKDGSKKKAILVISIIGIIAAVLLTLFWNIFCLIDLILYVILLAVGMNQGPKKEPLPKGNPKPLDSDREDTSNNC